MHQQIADIQSRLDGIVEELTDVSVQVLREAVEAGETRRPEIDKRLTRARRAIERAARLLSVDADADTDLG